MIQEEPRYRTFLSNSAQASSKIRTRAGVMDELAREMAMKWLYGYEMAILKRADRRRTENCKRDNGAAGLPKENSRR